MGRGRSDPGDLLEPGGRISERGQVLPDLLIEGGDVGVGGVDAGQHPGQHLGRQEPVMIIEGGQRQPGERFLQLTDLDPHPSPGQLGQGLGVAYCNAQVLYLNRLGAQSYWAHHCTAKRASIWPRPKFVMKETPSVGLGPGAVATSSELGTRLDLLKDGQPAAAREDVGGSWIGPARSGVWAEFRWPEAMKITSVQIYGTDGVGSRTKSGLLVLGFGPSSVRRSTPIHSALLIAATSA